MMRIKPGGLVGLLERARWVRTYQIVRDVGGFTDPNRVKPGTITTVVGSWFPIPNEHMVTIPEVAAGTYRISDQSRDDVTGFVYVEVVDP